MASFNGKKITAGETGSIREPESTNGDMKWTDANIDKLFQEKAEKLSFEFDEAYLDDLHASLEAEAVGQGESTTDADIDKMYENASDNMQFEYSDTYWQEFSAMMPGLEPVDLDANTDIDQLYQNATEKVNLEYNDSYWQEFSEGLEQPHGIDELYQNESAELTFEYKESYWNEMLGFLNRRRRPDFLWFGLAVLFLGLLTTTTFLHDPQLVMNEQTIAQSQSTQIEAEDINSNVIPENEALKSSDHHVNIIREDIESDPNVTDVQRSSNSNTNSTAGVSNNSGEDVDETNANLSNGDNTANVVTSDVNNNTQESKDQGIDRAEQNEITNQGNENSSIAVVESNENVVNNSEVNNSPDRSGSGNGQIEESSGNDVASEKVENFEVGDLATIPIVQTNIERNIINVPVDLKLSDGPKPPMSARLYLEANGGLSQSLVTPSDSYSYSVGAGLGVQLDKGRWSMNIGANAVWSFHNDLILNGEAKVYGFGSDVYRYTLKYDEIYTLEGVISAGYRFGRSSINVGVRPSYMLNTKVGYSMEEEEIEADRQMTYGYTEGLNRFNLKATLGYSIDLSGGIVIGANIGTRLLKSVDEQYLNGSNNTMPIDGQIYIRKLIKFRK